MPTSGYTKSFKGQVIKRPFAVGSKSEHEAVCLVDASGRSFKLRRLGGVPYADELLERLVGKSIAGHGRVIAGNTVVLAEWKEIAAQPGTSIVPGGSSGLPEDE